MASMKKVKLSPKQQHQLDVELINTKPKSRTEAKAQLAAKLRISKRKDKGRKGFKGKVGAKQSLDRANTSFWGRIVESIDTNRISDSNKSMAWENCRLMSDFNIAAKSKRRAGQG
jgi:hypothetical protein